MIARWALALLFVLGVACGEDASTSAVAPNAPTDASRPVDGAPSDAGNPAPPKYVHVQDGELVDGAGKPLIMRSIGLGNWLVPEGYMWNFDDERGDRPRRIEARVEELIGKAPAAAFWAAWRDKFIAEADIARVKELGFDTVRVALSARLLLPEGKDEFAEDGFAHLERLVKWCRTHGVYVVFDMHAAPGGQTGANIDDSVADSPELFRADDAQARLVRIWTEIARRFEGSDTVIGYDLLNEPIAPQHLALNSRLWPVYRAVAAAIRAVDRHHVLIVEGAAWANDWSALKEPFDENLIYSFHKYWDTPDEASIKKYLDHRADWKRPLWVGEFGENDDPWYSAATSLLESHHIGWSFWTWKKMESDNNPYSVAAPSGWPVIQAFIADPTKKPSPAAAQAIFDQLIANVELARCRFNRHAVCALLPCP